jgi:hypothetical protein
MLVPIILLKMPAHPSPNVRAGVALAPDGKVMTEEAIISEVSLIQGDLIGSRFLPISDWSLYTDDWSYWYRNGYDEGLR